MNFKLIDKDNIKDHILDIYTNRDNDIHYEFISHSPNDTILLAKNFASNLKKGDIININGELGCGKTVFMSGIAKYFNIESQVCSPTFTIVNEYDNIPPIYHFDVYRISDCDEFLDGIGTDYFENGICVIEWGNIIKELLPKSTVNIDIFKDENDENIRIFKIWREK